jgi:hypothetical protein
LLKGTHVLHEGQCLGGQILAALRVQQVLQAAQVLATLLHLRQLGISALLRLHHFLTQLCQLRLLLLIFCAQLALHSFQTLTQRRLGLLLGEYLVARLQALDGASFAHLSKERVSRVRMQQFVIFINLGIILFWLVLGNFKSHSVSILTVRR